MKIVYDIKREFEQCPMEDISKLIELYSTDTRGGVQKIIQTHMRKLEKYQKEILRVETMLEFEKIYHEKGHEFIAGVDEVGRGPLAGPVVSAAVILPKGLIIPNVNDSKKLPQRKREELCEIIKEKAIDVGIGIVGVRSIDNFNILNASKTSMIMAVEELKQAPDYVLVDGRFTIKINIPQRPIVRGDEKSISIACASIIAKVARDSMMDEYHKEYPEYGFATNKGYGTPEHFDAIKKYGLTPIHRKTFCSQFLL